MVATVKVAKERSSVAVNKKTMKCNVPRREVSGGKKSVVKACQGGKEKIVRFGDSKMSIKKSNPIAVELRVKRCEIPHRVCPAIPLRRHPASKRLSFENNFIGWFIKEESSPFFEQRAMMEE